MAENPTPNPSQGDLVAHTYQQTLQHLNPGVFELELAHLVEPQKAGFCHVCPVHLGLLAEKHDPKEVPRIWAISAASLLAHHPMVWPRCWDRASLTPDQPVMPYDNCDLLVRLVGWLPSQKAQVKFVEPGTLSEFVDLLNEVKQKKTAWLSQLVEGNLPGCKTQRTLRRNCPNCFINPVSISYLYREALCPVTKLSDLAPEFRVVFARESRLVGLPVCRQASQPPTPLGPKLDDIVVSDDETMDADEEDDSAEPPTRGDLNMVWHMEAGAKILQKHDQNYVAWLKADHRHYAIRARASDQAWAARLWERFYVDAAGAAAAAAKD